MLISESAARAKWCPFVRVENGNRLNNSITDGFENSDKVYHCIAGSCMGWREFHISHYKGTLTGEPEKHGYCGYAGRPEVD